MEFARYVREADQLALTEPAGDRESLRDRPWRELLKEVG